MFICSLIISDCNANLDIVQTNEGLALFIISLLFRPHLFILSLIYLIIRRNQKTYINLIGLAREIVSRRNTKLSTIVIVIVDASLNFVRLFTITFQSTINPSYGGTKSLAYHRMNILHPEPQCRRRRPEPLFRAHSTRQS